MLGIGLVSKVKRVLFFVTSSEHRLQDGANAGGACPYQRGNDLERLYMNALVGGHALPCPGGLRHNRPFLQDRQRCH